MASLHNQAAVYTADCPPHKSPQRIRTRCAAGHFLLLGDEPSPSSPPAMPPVPLSVSFGDISPAGERCRASSGWCTDRQAKGVDGEAQSAGNTLCISEHLRNASCPLQPPGCVPDWAGAYTKRGGSRNTPLTLWPSGASRSQRPVQKQWNEKPQSFAGGWPAAQKKSSRRSTLAAPFQTRSLLPSIA